MEVWNKSNSVGHTACTPCSPSDQMCLLTGQTSKHETSTQCRANVNYLFNLRPIIYKSWCLNFHFILNQGALVGKYNRLKTTIDVINRQWVKRTLLTHSFNFVCVFYFFRFSKMICFHLSERKMNLMLLRYLSHVWLSKCPLGISFNWQSQRAASTSSPNWER